MFSIVCCSVDPARADAISRHYDQLFGGEAYELISVRNPRSLAEGYNHGADRARGDVVIFSHDDIEFLEPATWSKNLSEHMSRFDIVGLAGTSRLISPAWAQCGPPYAFGQVGEFDGRLAPFRVLIFSTPSRVVSGIQALDGLFFAVRRAVLARVRFDALTFDAFHCYDVDFTFSAHRAGFRLAVACDLPVMHASQGKFDRRWNEYAQRLVRKHAGNLFPSPLRPFTYATAGVQTKEEALQLMTDARSVWPDDDTKCLSPQDGPSR